MFKDIIIKILYFNYYFVKNSSYAVHVMDDNTGNTKSQQEQQRILNYRQKKHFVQYCDVIHICYIDF